MIQHKVGGDIVDNTIFRLSFEHSLILIKV